MLRLNLSFSLCVMLNPTAAALQFFKIYYIRILPRTVHTSDAATAAGLTMAAMRNGETGEFGIEIRLLLLADKGVCCVHEFNKMDQLDQTSIHGATGQQTMIIAKAGIEAILNARAGILAAANSIIDTYDKSRPLQVYVAPLSPRFEQFFVVVHECGQTSDIHVTQHIVAHHQGIEIDTSFRIESREAEIGNDSGGSDNSNRIAHMHFQDDIRV